MQHGWRWPVMTPAWVITPGCLHPHPISDITKATGLNSVAHNMNKIHKAMYFVLKVSKQKHEYIFNIPQT